MREIARLQSLSVLSSHLDYLPVQIQVSFLLPSLLVMSIFSATPHISLLDSGKRVSYLQVNKGNAVSHGHCSTDFQLTSPTELLLMSTQALTMHFEGQRLGGVVWRSHILGIGHTAVGPLKEPSCTGDEQDQTLCSPFDLH